ncbi:MAG: ATP-binding protein [Planctomycetota bacterium]
MDLRAERGGAPAVEISVPSSAEYLSLIRSVAGWFAARCGFEEKDCGRIVLSAVEATTNIIRHAYGGDPGQRITIRFRELEDGLECEFLDAGKNVLAEGLVESARGELDAGGLGVRMMQTCMDELRYEVRPEGGARLVLRKRRRPGADSDRSGAGREEGIP